MGTVLRPGGCSRTVRQTQRRADAAAGQAELVRLRLRTHLPVRTLRGPIKGSWGMPARSGRRREMVLVTSDPRKSDNNGDTCIGTIRAPTKDVGAHVHLLQ